MAAVNLPSHVTLEANTVATVQANGIWSRLHVLNQSSTAVVYARTDGGTPVAAADLNHVISGVGGVARCLVAMKDASTSTTSIKLISTGTPTVSIWPCDCDGE